MTSLLSTGKKKAKASRVFGGDVFEEGADTSLWYSPSPRSSKVSIQSNNSASGENPDPVVLFGDSQKSTSEDKENESGNVMMEGAPSTLNDMQKPKTFQSLRDAELTRLRATKSPERRSRMEKTKAAIESASSEVRKTLKTPSSKFQALNACRKAKKAVIIDKGNQVKSVRFKWDEEKNDAKKFYTKVEENRRQLLSIQRQLASAHFQQKARKQEGQRLQYIAELDKESQFNSEVFRDHQQKLKDERNRSRKKSIDARAKLRENKKLGEEKLQNMKRDEESAIFEVRADLHLARREAIRENSEQRRKSFQFRAGDAKRIHRIRSQWQHKDQVERHQSFELNRAAARDVDTYKMQLDKERRESFQSRLKEGRRQRAKEQDEAMAAMKAEHESYELKWAGEKDVEEYQAKMREERRKSLAARNKESFRHSQVMQELRSLNLEREAESFMLKFAGENDANEYLKTLADERRQSLQQRAEEARKQRMHEDEQRQKAVSEGIQEGMLQSECQKDIEAYRKEMAEKARKSLEFRGKEAKMKRLEAENQRMKILSQEHKSFELDSLARMDVEKYLKECKQRRRKSLAFRAKEKRRHAEWKQRQHEKEVEERQKTGHFQALDYQFMALAEQQERARIAMDALRSVGCDVKGNPFGELLGNL